MICHQIESLMPLFLTLLEKFGLIPNMYLISIMYILWNFIEQINLDYLMWSDKLCMIYVYYKRKNFKVVINIFYSCTLESRFIQKMQTTDLQYVDETTKNKILCYCRYGILMINVLHYLNAWEPKRSSKFTGKILWSTTYVFMIEIPWNGNERTFNQSYPSVDM